MVSLFVGVTDQVWFERLRTLAERGPLDEVNFWKPSGDTDFRALARGELFLFKLHAPDNFIVGGGVFSHASRIPLSLAWEALGPKNGASSQAEMLKRVTSYRRGAASQDPHQDPLIGCRILTQPFFWPRDMWMPAPAGWSPNIVQGKGYQTGDREGQVLWSEVTERMEAVAQMQVREPMPARRYGEPQLITPRLGQGAFRLTVIDSYERRCAVSGERTLPILDAAHIRAYEAGGEHAPSNGLLLRTDIHRLFDHGYVTVSPEGLFEVSRRLKEDFDNGRHYYDLQGARVRLPRDLSDRPAQEALVWHRENRYRG
jgi:putative restriction endonuclease